MLFSRKKKIGDLRSVFPFESFQGDIAIAIDGTLSVCYQLKLPYEEQIKEEDFEERITLLAVSLQQLPLHTSLQQIDIYFPAIWENEPLSAASFFQTKQLKHLEGRSILEHSSYLVLSFPGIRKDFDSLNTFFVSSKESILKKGPLNGLEERLQLAREHIQQFEANVVSLFDLERLNNEAFSKLAHQYISLNFKSDYTHMEGGFWQEDSHLDIAETKVKIISLLESTETPLHTDTNHFGNNGGVASPFTDALGRRLNFPHIVVRVIRMIDSESFLSKQSSNVASSLAFKFNERASLNTANMRDQIAEFEEQIKKEGEPIVTLSLMVIPFGSNLTNVHNQCNEVLAAFSKMGMRGYVEGKEDRANLFLASLPGNGNQIYRHLPIPLQTAVAHLNCVRPFSGHREGILLSNRYQEPICFNPFNTDIDNQNAFIFGPSGSGKSFFNGKMIKDRFYAGHTVIVIDSGGTYRHLFEALGGKYIELSSEKKLDLNPFLVPLNKEGNYVPDDNKVLFLVQLIGKMWKGDLNQSPLTEVEKALLSKWIPTYYKLLKKGNIPTLTGFYDYLKKQLDENNAEILSLQKEKLFHFQEFFIVLGPFAHGVYKEHFNSLNPTHLLDHKLVCFELESLKGNAKLYPLVVQILFDFAFNMVSANPEETKFIDIEEGWTMLDDASEEHIESFFRKGRKTKTSIRIITQDIGEIQGSRIAGAMKNNAASFILLYNEKDSSRREIGDFLGMNALDMQKYASLRRRDGKDGYREVFIKEMANSNVWLLATSLWEHAMITSKPDERNKIASLTKSLGSIEDGIAAWVAQTKRKYDV